MKAIEALKRSNQSRIQPLRDKIDKLILEETEKETDNNQCIHHCVYTSEYSLTTIREVCEGLKNDGYSVNRSEEKTHEHGEFIELFISWSNAE